MVAAFLDAMPSRWISPGHAHRIVVVVSAFVFAAASAGGQASAQGLVSSRDRAETSQFLRVADFDATTEYYRGYRDALRDMSRFDRWRQPYRGPSAGARGDPATGRRDGREAAVTGPAGRQSRWVERDPGRASGPPAEQAERGTEVGRPPDGRQGQIPPDARPPGSSSAPADRLQSPDVPPDGSPPVTGRSSAAIRDPISRSPPGEATVFGYGPVDPPR